MIYQTFYSRRGEKKTKQTKTHKTLRSQMMPSKFTHFSTARGALHELLRSNVLGHFPFYAAQHLRQLCGRRQFVYFSLCGSVRTCQQEASNLLEARFWPANSIKRPFVFLCVCSQQSVWRALFLFMYVCVCVCGLIVRGIVHRGLPHPQMFGRHATLSRASPIRSGDLTRHSIAQRPHLPSSC